MNENGRVIAISVDFSFFKSKYSLSTFEIKARLKSFIVDLFFFESSLIFYTEISIDVAELKLPDMYLGCFFITFTSSFFFQ